MKIKLTEFALRHFDKKFGSTKILNYTPEEFEKALVNFDIKQDEIGLFYPDGVCWISSLNGYAPFCKLLPIKNFTDARVGSLPITLENYQYLRSGYSARRDSELPIFSRWLELPLGKPKAEYLMLVLYNKEQLDKEGRINEGEGENPDEKYIPFEADWGIVAILGQNHPNEEPMKPETMLRNALGIEYGGSGVSLDKEKYLESVDFWEKNATLK